MRRVEVDGVALAVRDEGEGPPVLLLHGFPDSSAVWRLQIPALLDAGFRVLAPDLRGFGRSDKPQDVDSYRVTSLVGDVLAILDDAGVARAHVVGHDWGAGLAWIVAGLAPDRVDRLVVLSVGHPNTGREPTLEERRLAWYQLWFLFPGVAETVLLRDDARILREWAAGSPDVDRYVEELTRPGALVAGLNWYRANIRPERELAQREPFASVSAPTLGLWSTGDDYLAERPLRESGGHVTGGFRYERIDGASHWLQLDEPERVNELLLEHLGG